MRLYLARRLPLVDHFKELAADLRGSELNKLGLLISSSSDPPYLRKIRGQVCGLAISVLDNNLAWRGHGSPGEWSLRL